jgi:hypothetical protein
MQPEAATRIKQKHDAIRTVFVTAPEQAGSIFCKAKTKVKRKYKDIQIVPRLYKNITHQLEMSKNTNEKELFPPICRIGGNITARK